MSKWVRETVAGLNHGALSAAIFSGQIIYFEGLPTMASAVHEMRKLLRAAFSPWSPQTAHQFLTSQEHSDRFSEAVQAFRNSAAIKELIYRAICAAGVHGPDTFCDRLQLRASPPSILKADRPYYRNVTPAHRDSWGSAIRCQINWWSPIYPLQPDNTLVIYPAHWDKAIENNALGWDWRQVDTNPHVPRLPMALGPVDSMDEVRLLMRPGVLAAFSAAHLHAGVTNTTDLTRFSIETRTVDVKDLTSGRGAQIVDGLGERPAFSWFSRMTDDFSLAEFLSVK